MTKRQIEQCAERLHKAGLERESRMFSRDMAQAEHLMDLGARIRANTWANYRRWLNLPEPAKKTTKKPKG